MCGMRKRNDDLITHSWTKACLLVINLVTNLGKHEID